MQTRIDEIGAGMYRLSIFVPEIAPPAGFTFNHFLIAGDEPLLFHCGSRWNSYAGLASDISRQTSADQ